MTMSLKTLAARIEYDGGNQLDRIKKQKLRSLQSALKNDYNSRLIKTDKKLAWKALINEHQLQQEYDKKIISVEYDAGLSPGDTFEILDNGSHWMIYLPYETETAYLRAQIIRCSYQVMVEDRPYWVYFQGPLENDISWYLKQNISINELNYKGTIFIKDDPRTNNFFKRFTKFKIDGHVWEVQTVDRITVGGILEVEIREYFDDKYSDVPDVSPDGICTRSNPILGLEEVRQEMEVGYQIRDGFFNDKYRWDVVGNPRVEIKNVSESGNACTVKIHDGAIRGFNVVYGDAFCAHSLPVTINIDEPSIKGADCVYPYDVVQFSSAIDGVFSTSDEKLAKITDQDGNRCCVEILTGKSGKFTLFLKDNDGKLYSKDVSIKSL